MLVNVQAEKQFGYPRDELLGQRVGAIIPGNATGELIARALESAESPVELAVRQAIELEGRHKDGTAYPIEIMLSPLVTTDGRLVTVAIRDITRRKTAKAQLLRTMEETSR